MNIRRFAAASALALTFVITSVPAFGQSIGPTLTDAQMEQFLLKAKVVSAKPVGIGITGSLRATMSDGTLTHDAHIQLIDVTKPRLEHGKVVELNFRDTWRYNVAAYKLDRLLDLQLVPVSVERRWNGYPAAFTWWVDDVMMDERKRVAKQLVAPNHGCWAQQSQALRMFDKLIENTDRNLGNTLIATNWRVWAIDHTRAFRQSPRPQSVADLTTIDRVVLERLAALSLPTLKKAIGRYVDASEIRSLLSRRDAILAHYQKIQVSAVVDRMDPSTGCHVLYTNATASR